MRKKNACVYYFLSLSVYIDVRGSLDWVCLLMGVRMWGSWGPPCFVFIFIVCFESEMSDLLLGALGHCPFHHYVHCWCDFISCLIWVDHYSSLRFSFHHHLRFCFWSILFVSLLVLLLQRPIPGLILSLHHPYTSHYQFNCLHCFVIVTIFTLSTLKYMAHEFLYMLHFHTWGHGFFLSLGIWA